MNDADEDRLDRLRILKAASGIDDEDFLFSVLEGNGWNLEDSLNLLVGDAGGAPTNAHLQRDLAIDSRRRRSPVVVDLSGESLEAAVPQTLIVRWMDHDVRVNVQEGMTVRDLKRALAQQTGVSPSSQELLGWPLDREPLDSTPLASVPFPAGGGLILLGEPDAQHPRNNDDEDVVMLDGDGEEDGLFARLRVVVLWEGQEHVFTLPAENTVSDLRMHVSRTLGVSPGSQQLRHLPTMEALDGQRTLASVAARFGERSLRFSLAVTEDWDADESDDDGAADADDVAMEPLLVDPSAEDEALACAQFAANFGPVYGEPHPDFFVGPLADALRTSRITCKPVLLYVHRSTARGVRDFCRSVLCSAIITDYLRENYIVWAWDVTSNRGQLMHLVEILNAAFEDYPFSGGTAFPTFGVATRMAGAWTMEAVRAGVQSTDAFYAWLVEAHEAASVHLVAALAADRELEEERAMRELIRTEQDAAYQASLAEDQRRAAERDAILQEQRARAASLEEKERARSLALESLAGSAPPEPPVGSPDAFELLLRLPSGIRLRRRFLPSHTVRDLTAVVACQGLLPGEYRLFRMHPRMDLGGIGGESTLLSVGIAPRDTLVVEAQ